MTGDNLVAFTGRSGSTEYPMHFMQYSRAAMHRSQPRGQDHNEGAGIFANNGTVYLTGVTLSNNTATENGGAIYSDPSLVTITSYTFSGNSASLGADLFNEDSAVTIINSTVTDVANTSAAVTIRFDDLFAQVSSFKQAAQQSLARGNTSAAANQLGACVNQLDALVQSHRLNEEMVESLVHDLDSLIAFIG